MDTDRASKRRKLDTPKRAGNNQASPDSRKDATLQSTSKSTPTSRKRLTSDLPSSGAKDGRASGANGIESPAPQGALEKLKARKAARDGGQQSESSPVAPRSNGKTPRVKNTAGFFKRFTEPLKFQAGNGTKTEGEHIATGSTQKSSNGTISRDGAGDQSRPEESEPPSGRSKRIASKNMSSAVRQNQEKGKTFEEEIRELEEAARRDAQNVDTEKATPARRASGRRSMPAKPTPPPAAVKASKAKAPAKAKPQPETQAEREASVKEQPPAPEEPQDATEVDESMDDDRESSPESIAAVTVRSRISPATSKPTPGKTKSQPSHVAELYPEQLHLLQNMALERVNGSRPARLTNLQDEYTKVNTVIQQTITAGESNSMLLIGARGSGKTAVINHILREQAIGHPDEFHVVRLNGFIHTDDKIALREIWRQLGREMELDEDENTVRNYADTLATLLALLSSPAELGQEEAPGQSTKSVIFILDEFELFASHPRQTLLYNLFDIAQSRKAPIAVLGLTTRIDVAEALEKRVKSRFSHRYVHLSLAKNFGAFLETCNAALSFHANQLSNPEKLVLAANSDLHGKLARSSGKPSPAALETWNTAIDTLLSTKEINSFLLRIYYTTKSVSAILSALHIPLATLPSSATTSSSITSHLTTTLLSTGTLSPPDSKLTLLYTLSTLQLALLICAARQTAIHNTDSVSFNLAYEEYKILASKAKIQAAASGALGSGGRVWGKGVARDAWESLVEAGLVMEGGRVDVGLEEIGECGVELGGWGRWCREI